ncbi:adenosylcobinamide-GDP ribazoletransferase [Arsenicicoccus sp. oral taxon 190]|uniref:adenosylcobinamide-GDP ribazoletransferase n=1 Tax=Arsenicicoccus sp. oral taxon 190 TaxID=1658671 RepID=UPI00067A1CD4|nr:adenosylcobinamide-GDP ribazoletransferase [Arsenicicoccus sp. oral taxon 190]AKT52096.1 hypothetical protein ADJ73_13870 [Arsenicicoccus sp. oral taxon 190]
MTGPARAGRWADGLRLAWGTLSAVPVPPPRRVDRPVAGAAMLLAPLAALPLVAAWVGWALLARWAGSPPLVTGGVAVALGVLLTRAMHQDGLADYSDGLSASYDRERALAVMKTGDVGPSGATAIALSLLVQAACLGALAPAPGGITLGAVALVTSRHVLAWACLRGVPSARPSGLGDMVAGSVARWQALTALAVVAGVTVVAAGPSALWAGLACVAAGLVGCWLVVERAVRRLGGITGDVLGAAIEVSLSLALVAASLLR